MNQIETSSDLHALVVPTGNVCLISTFDPSLYSSEHYYARETQIISAKLIFSFYVVGGLMMYT